MYARGVFDSIGWSEILVLVVLALFILGPDRLPEAASWLGRNIRKIREFATGARRQLRDEIGPELDEWQQPLQDLRSLRTLDPKRAVTQHLFDGNEDPLGLYDETVNGNGRGAPSNGRRGPRTTDAEERLPPGEQPPVDPDAT